MEKMIKYPALFGGDMLDQFFDYIDRNQWNDNSYVYPMDIIENKKDNTVIGYEIVMALAGVPKENIDISLDGDTLNISVGKVEKQTEKEGVSRIFVKNGISRRQAKASFALHGIDKGKITSSFENGMLTVKVPLAEESMPRKITIG